MADHQLTEDKVQAEQLKDQLVLLRDSRAYQLLQRQMADLLSLDQRLLEKEVQPVRIYQLQGRLACRKQDIGLLSDLISKIDNEHKQHQLKGQGDGSTSSDTTLE